MTNNWPSSARRLLALLISVAPALFAGGFEGSGIGTRALSMGGAFVGLADDWTAGFWNPAGLSFAGKSGTGLSVDLLSLHALDGNSIANPLPPHTQANTQQGDPFSQLGGEPSRFGVTDTTIHAALPSVAGFQTWGPWSFSLGVFAPLGYKFTLEDATLPGYSISYESQGSILEYNLSLSRKIGDRFSLGAGVNFLDASVKRDAVKTTATYQYRAAADGRGHAVQGVFGFLGKVTSALSIGGAYKTGSDIELDGTASISDSRFPLTIPGIGTLANESSAQTITLHNPATYSLGLAWTPLRAWTWTTDWEGTDWRPMRDKVDFAQQGTILQTQDYDAHWRFTNRARVGTEYRWSYSEEREMIARAGYTWDPSAVPDSSVSVTNLVDVSRNVLTLGIAWKIRNWEPAIGLAYGSGSRHVNGVDYKKVDRLLSVGFHYRTL